MVQKVTIHQRNLNSNHVYNRNHKLGFVKPQSSIRTVSNHPRQVWTTFPSLYLHTELLIMEIFTRWSASKASKASVCSVPLNKLLIIIKTRTHDLSKCRGFIRVPKASREGGPKKRFEHPVVNIMNQQIIAYKSSFLKFTGHSPRQTISTVTMADIQVNIIGLPTLPALWSSLFWCF